MRANEGDKADRRNVDTLELLAAAREDGEHLILTVPEGDEKPATFRSATSVRPTVSSAPAAAASGSATRCRRAMSSTTSCAVRNGHGGL